MSTKTRFSRSAAIAELASIIGHKPASVSAGLDAAVDTLLVVGRGLASFWPRRPARGDEEAYAVDLCERLSAVADSSRVVTESNTRAALEYAAYQYADYSSREPADVIRIVPVVEFADGETVPVFGLPCPKHHHAPHGPALRPTFVSEVCGPTARQQASRFTSESAAAAGAKHRKYAADAATTKERARLRKQASRARQAAVK